MNKSLLYRAVPFVWLLLTVTVLFLPGLAGDGRLVSLDDKAVLQARYGDLLRDSSANLGWNPREAGGWHYFTLPYNIRTMLAPRLPAETVLQLSYLLSLLVGGAGFYLFMRHRRLDRPASLFGAVGWMLTGSVVTLIMPGHLGKLLSLAPVPFYFLFLRKGVIENSIFSYIYAGFFLAASFWGRGFEMAVYFGFAGAAYWLFLLAAQRSDREKLVHWIRRQRRQLLRHAGSALLLAAIAGMLAVMVVPVISSSSGTRGAELARLQTPQQKWNWATQWSLPPEELIDFVIPGLFGWKSNDPVAPYWGRLGRDPAWDAYTPQQQQQAMRNMKLNSENIGMLLFLLALLALMHGLRVRRDESRFWLGMALISLLLALGKFLYLPYYLFYQLPFMDMFRNPNKFIKLTAFAFAVLGAHGFQLLFVSCREKLQERDDLHNLLRRFLKGLRVGTVVLGAVAALSFFMKGSLTEMITDALGHSRGAAGVAAYYPVAFVLAGTVALFLYLVMNAVFRGRLDARRMQWIGYAAVAVLAGELLLADRHFVTFVSPQVQTRNNYGIPAEQLVQAGLPAVLFDESQHGPVTRLFTGSSGQPAPRVWVEPQGPWVRMLADGKFLRLGLDKITLVNTVPVSTRLTDFFAAVTGRYSAVDKVLQLMRLNPAYRSYLQQNYFQLPQILGNPALLKQIPEQERNKVSAGLQQIFQTVRTQWMTCMRLTGCGYLLTAGTNLPPGAVPLDWTGGKNYPVLRRIPWSPSVASVPGAFPRAYLAASGRFSPQPVLRALLAGSGLQQSVLLERETFPAGVRIPSGTLPTDARIRVVSYEANTVRLAVNVSKPALAVLSDLYHPGWQASVNGKPVPVFPVNWLHRGVAVPAGESEVLFRFVPDAGLMRSVWAGLLLVLSAAAVQGGLLLRRRFFRRSDAKDAVK